MSNRTLGLVVTVLVLSSLVLAGCGGGGDSPASPGAATTAGTPGSGATAAPAAGNTLSAEQSTNLTRVAMYAMLRTPTKTRPPEAAATEPATLAAATATTESSAATVVATAATAATTPLTAAESTNLTRVAMMSGLRTPTKTRPPEAAATAPAASAAVTATTEAGTDGQKIFQANCATCHNLDTARKVGPGLGGLFALAALPNGKPVTDENVAEAIRTVHAPKETFAGLQSADMAALLAYLKQVTKQ